MSTNYVTTADLEAEIGRLIDAQKAREDENARRLYEQLTAMRNRLSQLEEKFYNLENPPEPAEEEEGEPLLKKGFLAKIFGSKNV